MKKLIHEITLSVLKVTTLVIFLFLTNHANGQASIMINEVSQGTSGSKEYVEFIVTGPALVNCDDTPPCIDLRFWVFDDNNGNLNTGGPQSGVGIAAGACRFADDPFWACIPAGTIIVIYNDNDVNSGWPADDVNMADGNCTLNIPISSNLFDHHPSQPTSSNATYPTTGWIPGGNWNDISMANGGDGFQIYDPANMTSPVSSVGWDEDDLAQIYFPNSSMSGTVAYATDCNFLTQGSWVTGSAGTFGTPGAPNTVTQADCIGNMNANCNPPTVVINTTPASCGACDGTATATITGGTAPFSLTWSLAPGGGQGTTTATGLCQGNYTLTLVDDNGTGCQLVTNTTIGGGTDAIPPIINCPGNLTAICSITEHPAYASFADFTTAGGSASDAQTGIDAGSFILLSDVSDGNSCPEVVTRTYQITDNCGNTSTCVQTITVNDNIPPTASNLTPVAVQCPANVPAVNILDVIDEADNCGVPTVAFVSDVSDGLTCPETITRTYSVTDDCGNTINVTQTITVNDTQAPVFDPAPASVSVQCPTVVPTMTNLNYTDNCDPSGFVTGVDGPLIGGNCGGTITRTWTFTDACGNTATATQTITVDDTTPPTGTPPANISVECATDVPAADPLLITDEADNCSVPVVAFVSDVSDGNTCPEVITRTYSITDACGNVTNVTQTITVDDITPPTGTAPAAIAVECISDVPAADPLLITDEADNCGTPTVAFVGDVSDGNACPETITRTYSITDSCGNSITVDQIITVDDITPPTGTAPADITVECIGDVPVADPLLITDEADNCPLPIVVAFVSDVSDGNTCPEVITRTYSITDACGNVTNITQTITVDDTTPPTASNAAQTIVPGGPAPAPDPTVIIDEADNCGVPVVAFVSQVSDGNPCPELITYTYSVTDACGNTINVTHEVLITDPIAPTGTAPADVNVECITAVPAPDPLLITDEADNNGLPTVTHLSDVSDGNSCPEVITRTYRITDPCGNFIDVTQLITVNDITPPTGTAPAAIAVECISDVPAADPLLITDEADNCGTPTVAFVGDVSDGNTCPETITRTYSITDSCGNSITVDQIITVDDITPPTGTAPTNMTVECIGDVPVADPLLITDEADNCPLPIVVAFVSDVSDGNTCPEVITRTYSITDACGNVTNITQTITVDDTTPPTASNAAQTIVPGGPAPAPDPTVIIDEADNCTAAPTVAFVSQVSDNNPCPESIIYTYSVTDDCGNSINVTHEVLITDPIMPTGTAPVDVNVECIGQVPAADPLLITDEADNNGVPVVAFVSDVSDGNTCPEVITRTYSITDVCGNQILVTQLITVNDITPPTASNPVAVNVECIGDVPAIDITVVTDEADNCTAAPVVAHVSDVSDGNTCPETITRTYSVTDDCGNTINVTQTITVNDITPPTADVLSQLDVSCPGDVPAPDPAVVTNTIDNCGTPVVAWVADVSDGLTCPETITRTYSVTDDCGNSMNIDQIIVINDDINPIANNPAPLAVSCASDIPVPDPAVVSGATDNCTANPNVVWVSDVSDGNTCNGETITRTYSVSDDCGNQILVQQIILIDAVTPNVDAGLDQTACEGSSVTLSSIVSPTTANVSWDNGIVDGVSFIPPVGTINYTVTAEVCNGECVATDQIDVVIEPSPTVSFYSDVNQGCENTSVTFTNTSSSQFDCQWEFGNGMTAIGCSDQTILYQNPGLYDVTLTVTSAAGCLGTMTYTDFIEIIEDPIALFNPSETLLTIEDTEVEFENNSINAVDYWWDFGDGSAGSPVFEPSHIFPNQTNGTYNVTLIAFNSLGCPDTAIVSIIVEEELIFYVPNVFTPDGDQYNETFQPVFTAGYDPYNFHLLIFNRWGELIFESYNAAIGWDGTYGDGGLVQDGVYVWKIKFKESMSDKKHTLYGHVTVLK